MGERPAEILSGDVLRATYEIKYAHRAFMARVASGRVEFYVSGELEPFGFIRAGSPMTGAIWLGPDCIGEYENPPGGVGTITPVVDGRKRPENQVATDPVTFLLHEAVTRMEGRPAAPASTAKNRTMPPVDKSPTQPS